MSLWYDRYCNTMKDTESDIRTQDVMQAIELTLRGQAGTIGQEELEVIAIQTDVQCMYGGIRTLCELGKIETEPPISEVAPETIGSITLLKEKASLAGQR